MSLLQTEPEHLKQKNKDEHLLSLIEVEYDDKGSGNEAEFLNNFDLVDFLDDDEWPFDFAQSVPLIREAGQQKSEYQSAAAVPLDDELYELEQLKRFGPVINF